MTRIRVTKEINFEMAHSLFNHDGLCSNIHGHSYKLLVTVIGKPLEEKKNPKDGMVIDFKDLKAISETVVNDYDHALLINNQYPDVLKDELKKNFNKISMKKFQPTCENILIEIANKIKSIIPSNIKLYSLKLQETDSSYVEWYLEDQ